ncbi:hypothetical protein [Candidatus Accumulibacter vicinus]|uniref:hypothetical protein n=1 Tax=Candidatus Accumulibacter vicinus TaxID=2954382 RepID=UPI00235B6A70|nr:hypothetical protein [Candidatus Accumulibacter vicinus]
MWLRPAFRAQAILAKGYPIERKVEKRDDEVAQITQGYCAAIRAALTGVDDFYSLPTITATGISKFPHVEQKPHQFLKVIVRSWLSACFLLW